MLNTHSDEIRTSVGSIQRIERCDICGGSGLTQTALGYMHVTLCNGCNGHGEVLVYEWVESILGEVIRRVSYVT